MTSKEALARLQEDDVVGRSGASGLRSSEHASALSGLASKPESDVMEMSADLMNSADLEDLEITPNLGKSQRPDTLPDWMLASPAPVAAAPAPAAPLRARKSGWHTALVVAVGLVAAGSWWFAADGVNALNPAPSVVAAAPAMAPAPVAMPPQVEPVQAQPTLTPAPTEPVAVQETAPKKASPKKTATRRAAKPKRTRRAAAKPAPVAPAKAVKQSRVAALTVGAAASGRGCRALGTILASEHERVNACFKVHAAPSLSAVVVQWRHNGALVRSTEHDLSGSKSVHAIRAFSRVQSGQSGSWTVQVRTPGGQILASKRFSVGM